MPARTDQAHVLSAAEAVRGEHGETLLTRGENLALRLWDEHRHPGGESTDLHAHAYEVVGYVMSGRARLHLSDDTLDLNPGDSWLVPGNVKHRYEILEPFTAVEASSPPAREA